MSAPTPTVERRTWRVAEAAAQLGVPVGTLRGWVRRGLIGTHRIGAGRRAVILVPAAELDALLERTLIVRRTA
jgi:excisionase family DNA binding protein